MDFVRFFCPAGRPLLPCPTELAPGHRFSCRILRLRQACGSRSARAIPPAGGNWQIRHSDQPLPGSGARQRWCLSGRAARLRQARAFPVQPGVL